MATIVAAISINLRATFARHQAGQQIVISPISTLLVFLFVSFPKYCFSFFVRNGSLVRIAAYLPLVARPVSPFASARVRSVYEFFVSIPNGMAGVGEGAVFKIDQRGVGHFDCHSRLQISTRLPASSTLQIVLDLNEGLVIRHKLALRQWLPFAHTDDLLVQFVPQNRPAASAPSLLDVLTHAPEAVNLRFLAVEFVKGFHQAFNNWVEYGVSLRKLQKYELDAQGFQQVFVELCVVLPA